MPTVFDVSSTNTWGLDVSQTMGGAGSVGGLLARTIRMPGGTLKKLYAHHDGRGNIIALTKEGTTLGATASVVARYEYDSYGRLISSSGVESANNLYRYQSKRLDVRSQNYDFGYRFYSPRFGRFISLDPIRESGGINLYGYVGNSPINGVDGRGLSYLGDVGDVVLGYVDAAVDTATDMAGPNVLGAGSLGGMPSSGASCSAPTSDARAFGKNFGGALLAVGLLAVGSAGPSSGPIGGGDYHLPGDVPNGYTIVKGGVPEVPGPGTVFSGSYGATPGEAAAAVPHGTIRVTTAGEIRNGGGTVSVLPELTKGNNLNGHHVNVTTGPNGGWFSGPFQNPILGRNRIK